VSIIFQEKPVRLPNSFKLKKEPKYNPGKSDAQGMFWKCGH